jgi:hypothetical protein
MINVIVSQALQLPGFSSPTTVQAQPPRYARVIAFVDGGPWSRDLLWDDASQSTVVGAALADLALDVIEAPLTPAMNAARSKFMGEQVIRISLSGAKPGDPSGGTSREFAGTVVAVYMRTPIQDAAGTGQIVLVVNANGEFFEDLASQFVILEP